MPRWTIPRVTLIVLLTAALLFLIAAPAGAEHTQDPRTGNLHPMGHIEEPASLLDPVIANPNVHTDIAFWGKYAIQGSWLGFNIRDISEPDNPAHVSSTSCAGDQGDVIVWEHIVVRSWNSPAGETATCGGATVPQGFEGLHIFDISDVTSPTLVGSVELSERTGADAFGCGSHTATGVPDPANNRLLVYNNSSNNDCPGIDIVEVPLDDPGSASVLAFEPAGRPCHDTGVILGDALMAACAGGNGFTVWSMDPADGGSLEDPVQMISKDVNEETQIDGVTIGHSAMFTWDGEVLIFGHEPGGGVGARCREEDPDVNKSAMFFRPTTGEFLGMWTLPRPQSDIENCTIHNYNLVPVRSGKYILVSGNYQSGTSVVDFSDPSNPVEIAWSDPPPLGVVGGPFCDELGCEIGGAWSSYWYNNFIYETNITEGLNVFRFSGSETAGAMRLDHLNPQTQEFTIP